MKKKKTKQNATSASGEQQRACAALHAYLKSNGDHFIACCAWLGGGRWRVLAQSLVLAILHGGRTGSLQIKLAYRVHSLLSLTLIDDLDSDEAGIFATLDLCDPRVESCCQHAEVLEAWLAAMNATSAADVVANEQRGAAAA